jgi:Uma2 family endonuclease
MSHAHADLPRPHRLTVADYYRMAEVGILAPDARVELKVPLYARHGVPEVWLVDLGGQRLVRYRSPEQGTYLLVDEPDLHADLGVAALEGVAVALQRLFG